MNRIASRGLSWRLGWDSYFATHLYCHPRESGGPGQVTERLPWTPAFAGVTDFKYGTINQTPLRGSPLQLDLPSSRSAYSSDWPAIALARSWYCSHSVPHSASTLVSSALARSIRPFSA